jgi:hypothetical protein
VHGVGHEAVRSDFSFAAWKTYCEQRVRPQHSHDPGQLARLDRLLSAPNIEAAWRSLADDVSPASPEPTWQGALHNVIATLIFPPGRIEKSELEQNGYLLKARRKFKATGINSLPLIPATMEGKNAERNWIALYLKTWIIPGFFKRKHYEEIAVLVNAALGLESDFSADQVRLLQPYHFRNRQRPEP